MHLSGDGIVSQLCNNRTCMHIDLVLLQLLALDGGKYSSELAYWFPRIANIKRFQLRRPTYSWEVLSIPTFVPRNGWVKWWWWESLYNTVPQHMHTAKGYCIGRAEETPLDGWKWQKRTTTVRLRAAEMLGFAVIEFNFLCNLPFYPRDLRCSVHPFLRWRLFRSSLVVRNYLPLSMRWVQSWGLLNLGCCDRP